MVCVANSRPSKPRKLDTSLPLYPQLPKFQPQPPTRKSQIDRRPGEIVSVSEQRFLYQLTLEHGGRFLEF